MLVARQHRALRPPRLQPPGTRSVPIAVATTPAGRGFTADGVAYSGTQTFNWVPGSSYGIAVASPQAGGVGTRYRFGPWSDGGAASHRVAVNPATSAADFAPEYQLVTAVDANGTLYGAGGVGASGTFTDWITVWSQSLGGLTVGPGGSYDGTFPLTGLASFAIAPDAQSGGPAVQGNIFLYYDLMVGTDAVGGYLTAQYGGQDALASVTVWASVPAPAPATAALLALGLAGLVARRRVAAAVASRVRGTPRRGLRPSRRGPCGRVGLGFGRGSPARS